MRGLGGGSKTVRVRLYSVNVKYRVQMSRLFMLGNQLQCWFKKKTLASRRTGRARARTFARAGSRFPLILLNLDWMEVKTTSIQESIG